jgi:hypothetical protein
MPPLVPRSAARCPPAEAPHAAMRLRSSRSGRRCRAASARRPCSRTTARGRNPPARGGSRSSPRRSRDRAGAARGGRGRWRGRPTPSCRRGSRPRPETAVCPRACRGRARSGAARSCMRRRGSPPPAAAWAPSARWAATNRRRRTPPGSRRERSRRARASNEPSPIVPAGERTRAGGRGRAAARPGGWSFGAGRCRGRERGDRGATGAPSCLAPSASVSSPPSAQLDGSPGRPRGVARCQPEDVSSKPRPHCRSSAASPRPARAPPKRSRRRARTTSATSVSALHQRGRDVYGHDGLADAAGGAGRRSSTRRSTS